MFITLKKFYFIIFSLIIGYIFFNVYISEDFAVKKNDQVRRKKREKNSQNKDLDLQLKRQFQKNLVNYGVVDINHGEDGENPMFMIFINVLLRVIEINATGKKLLLQ